MMNPVDQKIVYNKAFQDAIEERIKAGDDFYTILNAVAGCCMDVEINKNMPALGGAGEEKLQRIKDNAAPFEKAVFDALELFDGEPIDFRFTFLDTWVLVYNLMN